jgi:lysozyme
MSSRKKLYIGLAVLLILLFSKKVSASAIISKFEGIVRDKKDRTKIIAYKDFPGGIWTIGYGNTSNPFTGEKVKEGMVIDENTALSWLNKDIEVRQTALKKILKRTPTANQLSAMTSLAYNIGVKAFADSSIRKNFDIGDFKKAADSFLLYNKARKDGKLIVIEGLDKRRKLERELFLK